MIFTIKKHNQTSGNLFYKLFDFIHSKQRLSYFINFTNAPKYINKKQLCTRTINRLFGFICGYNKSVNFGWEYMNREIYIYVYYKLNKKTVSKFIQRIDFDREYTFTIYDKKSYYLFTIIDSKYNIKQFKVDKTTNPAINYNLYPKLNGNNVALNDINIDLINN